MNQHSNSNQDKNEKTTIGTREHVEDSAQCSHDRHEPADLWAGVPVIVQLVEELEGRVKLIDSLTQKQESPTSGVTADKSQVEELLIDSTLLVSGMLRGYAAREKNPMLLAKVKVTRSGLRALADGKLPEKATAIRELAVEQEEALADYGLKAADLTELESRTAAYEAVVMAPRNAIVSRTTLTQILKAEVRAATDLLREVLDHLLPQFEAEHPEFVTEEGGRAIEAQQGLRFRETAG